MGFTILGTGSALPERSVSNDELSEFLDTSDEWIFTRTGIKSRHVCTTESLDDLAVAASEQALQASGIDASQLDLIVCSTTTGDHLVPAEACAVAERLGATCPAFDVSAACAGFVFALDVAEGYIARGRAKRVLVVAAEQMTRALDWTDRATCVLFGDGAGAVLVEATEEEGVGVQNSYLRTDGKGLPFLHMKAGGSVCPPSHFTVAHRLHYLYQEGRTVFRYAVTDMSNDVAEVMKRNELTADDVKWVVPHEANLRIIEAVTKRIGLPMDKVVVNIERYGNTSAATIPLALWDNEKNMKKGDNVIFTAFGAGFVHGASFCKWAYDGSEVAGAK